MKLFIKIFLLALFSKLSFAQTLPSELMYQGKPIDSMCITDYDERSSKGMTLLATCGIANKKDMKQAGHNDELEKAGYTGYNFSYVGSGEAATTGYTYYKAFGKTGDYAIVFSVASGGGSGEFSTLALVKRQANSIQIEKIASGDRCNGGIYDVKRNESDPKVPVLSYNVNLTPFDFLELANDNPHHLKAYDDLDACAACCKGAAMYTRKIGRDFANEKIDHIGIDSDLDDENEPVNTKYQACFNKLLNGYKKKGIKELSMQQLKEFTKSFNATCVK